MDLNKLCNELNTRVLGHEALEVVNESGSMVIKVKKNMTPKLVKKMLLDDLITFYDGKAIVTSRLIEYAKELSHGEIEDSF